MSNGLCCRYCVTRHAVQLELSLSLSLTHTRAKLIIYTFVVARKNIHFHCAFRRRRKKEMTLAGRSDASLANFALLSVHRRVSDGKKKVSRATQGLTAYLKSWPAGDCFESNSSCTRNSKARVKRARVRAREAMVGVVLALMS